MRFSRASLALLAAGLASAQLPNLPACSLNCFVSALTSDGCSSLTDYACHCQKPQLVSDVTPCVQSACNVADQSSVSSAVVSQCSAAGHAISVPPVSAASTTTGTTTTESSTQTVTSTSTGTSTASSTTPSSSSPSSSQHHSSSSASTTTTSTSTESTTKTTSASASATTTLSNNVASNKANVAGVAAMAAAALYVL